MQGTILRCILYWDVKYLSYQTFALGTVPDKPVLKLISLLSKFHFMNEEGSALQKSIFDGKVTK